MSSVMRAFALLCAIAVLSIVASDARADDHAIEPGNGRAVLVTGATSGIGLYTAELLAENGFHVYAGARKQADMKRLDAMDNITAVRLDVTVQEDIDAAVEFVREQGRGLYALINNAGVVVVGPLVEMTEEEFHFQMNVNVYGVFRVTQAFTPMIIESKGRISTTSSISGYMPWFFGGPYVMSKHAVEGYTDVLALELAPFGVKVSAIQPGNYNSKISAGMVQRMRDRGYSPEGSLYAAQMQGVVGSDGDRSQFKEPTEVAEAFLKFLTDEEPTRRYMTVPSASEGRMTLQFALHRIAQLNQNQAYTFTREQLIEMLDKALEAAED